jgi:hypothetical protein
MSIWCGMIDETKKQIAIRCVIVVFNKKKKKDPPAGYANRIEYIDIGSTKDYFIGYIRIVVY